MNNKITLMDRIRFTKNGFKEAWYEGLVEATYKALNFASNPVKRRASIAGIGTLALGLGATTAAAAGDGSGTANCPAKNTATGNLVGLFKNIGLLLYIIGGVFCLVCFAGAAIMFMASGNNSGRADKAMRWAKNTVIGIAILAGGLFFRSIIVNFVSSSGQVVNGNGTDTSGAANNLLCDNINSGNVGAGG